MEYECQNKFKHTFKKKDFEKSIFKNDFLKEFDIIFLKFSLQNKVKEFIDLTVKKILSSVEEFSILI